MGNIRACERGWEYAQIFGGDGEVAICSWAAMNYRPIGRLANNTMYEIWHGEAAEAFRQSLIDGSYRYCEKEKCPWMANGTLDKHMKEYDGTTPYPTNISLSFQNTCNYTCTCCCDNENVRGKICHAEEKYMKIQKETEKFLNDATIISANGRGELFASKYIMEMLHNWKPTHPAQDIHVELETNGSLFNEKNWKVIENLGQYDLLVSITVMGFEEKTYQFLSGTKLPIQQVIDNLHFVRGLREKNIVNTFEIGTVVQERNFREMPEFTKRCIEEFHADCIRLRPYFPYGSKDMGASWLYDIRNPYHPYYSEYEEVMRDEIFNHPTVFMWSGKELSPMGRNPYAKDKENFDVIKFLAVDQHMNEKLERYFKRNGIDRILIHGIGFVGQSFVNLILKTDIKIEGIMDKNRSPEDCYEGIEIVKAGGAKYDSRIPIIVTAAFFYEEICGELQAVGMENPVYNIKDIVAEIIC